MRRHDMEPLSALVALCKGERHADVRRHNAYVT